MGANKEHRGMPHMTWHITQASMHIWWQTMSTLPPTWSEDVDRRPVQRCTARSWHDKHASQASASSVRSVMELLLTETSHAWPQRCSMAVLRSWAPTIACSASVHMIARHDVALDPTCFISSHPVSSQYILFHPKTLHCSSVHVCSLPCVSAPFCHFRMSFSCT